MVIRGWVVVVRDGGLPFVSGGWSFVVGDGCRGGVMKGESDRGEREEGMVWSEAGWSFVVGDGRSWWGDHRSWLSGCVGLLSVWGRRPCGVVIHVWDVVIRGGFVGVHGWGMVVRKGSLLSVCEMWLSMGGGGVHCHPCVGRGRPLMRSHHPWVQVRHWPSTWHAQHATSAVVPFCWHHRHCRSLFPLLLLSFLSSSLLLLLWLLGWWWW